MIIPGFSNYDITEDGIVTNLSTNRVVRPYIARIGNGKEYLRVTVTDDEGNKGGHSVIRLLALTYLVPPCHNAVVRAKDGNNLNATLENTEWVARGTLVGNAWNDGKFDNRCKRRNVCCSAASVDMLYGAMQAYDKPVSMTELSYDIQVPYSIVRYSMYALIDRGLARKTKDGFELCG